MSRINFKGRGDKAVTRQRANEIGTVPAEGYQLAYEGTVPNKPMNKIINELIAQDKQRLERIYKFIARGVKIIDPLTTHIAEKVRIGKGTVIYPLTVIESNVSIGKNCSIGPYARLRKEVRIKDNVSVGNFVEVVRTTISSGSKAKHLTYLGDTFVEEKVNIGAGTIIANYDGKDKHQTRIKRGAFIGSGSILVAPVKIGKNAITGAGAVVTKNHDVPNGTVVIGVPAKVLIRRDSSPGGYNRKQEGDCPCF